jgi:hypothetical protein
VAKFKCLGTTLTNQNLPNFRYSIYLSPFWGLFDS